MKLNDFHYELPEAQIARYPLEKRSDSRLLCLDGTTGNVQHCRFTALLDRVRSGDLMVFNDTRVIPARLFGQRESGGRVEVMVERLLDAQSCLAHVRASNRVREGSRIRINANHWLTVTGREPPLYRLQTAADESLTEMLDRDGHIPLPPYMERADEALDRQRYQTIYARIPGAVAAPTAGLHFTAEILDKLRARGVEFGYVTLHVGSGTFLPVRCDDIREHKMHREFARVSSTLVEQMQKTRARGGRVIAVGTTSVRCLESATCSGVIQPFTGDTGIFIYPGYRFQSVDVLLTNFHLPESTLIMLVSAFAGRKKVLAAYHQAVERGYRFFSYGDAMWVTPEAAEQSVTPQRDPIDEI